MAAQPDAPERTETTASPLDRHASPVSDRMTPSGAKSGKATASMIVGIIAIPMIFLFWPLSPILAIAGLILGFMAKGEIKRKGMTNGGMATAGIVCSFVALGLFVILFAVGAAIVAGSETS